MVSEVEDNEEEHNNKLKDMWIFDSGATSHMTNDPYGLYDIQECLECVEYGKSDSWFINKIKGYLDVKVKNKNGFINDITLTNVLYIEDLNFSVLSVFTARDHGFKLGESSNGPTLTNGDTILEAHVKIEAGMSYLMGFNMGRLRRNFNLMTYTQLHNRLGHPGSKKLEKTARNNSIELDDFHVEKCESCALAKSRRTNLNKTSKDP